MLKLQKIRTIIGIVKVTLSNNNHKWPTCRRFWRCRKYKMMCRYGQRLNQVHNHHLTISIYQINRTDSARVFYQTTKFDKQQTSTFCLLSRHPHVCKATSYRRQVSTDGSVPSRRTSVKPSKTQSGPVPSQTSPKPDQSQAGQSQAELSNAYFLSFRPKWKQFYRYLTGNILIGVIWTGMLVELDTLTEHERH